MIRVGPSIKVGYGRLVLEPLDESRVAGQVPGTPLQQLHVLLRRRRQCARELTRGHLKIRAIKGHVCDAHG